MEIELLRPGVGATIFNAMKGDLKFLKNSKHYLYILRDPFDRKIRYIGITSNLPKRRRTHIHMYDHSVPNEQFINWFNMLNARSANPLMEIVKVFDNKADAMKMERIIIEKIGGDLLNIQHKKINASLEVI